MTLIHVPENKYILGEQIIYKSKADFTVREIYFSNISKSTAFLLQGMFETGCFYLGCLRATFLIHYVVNTVLISLGHIPGYPQTQ